MIGRYERERGSDDLIPFGPRSLFLEEPNSQMEAGGGGIQKVGMREARILFPSFLELDRFEAQSGPSLLQTLSNLSQCFLYPEIRDENMDGFHDLLILLAKKGKFPVLSIRSQPRRSLFKPRS
jgi:hypothetical protein